MKVPIGQGARAEVADSYEVEFFIQLRVTLPEKYPRKLQISVGSLTKSYPKTATGTVVHVKLQVPRSVVLPSIDMSLAHLDVEGLKDIVADLKDI
jgi:hypothetical protein